MKSGIREHRAAAYYTAHVAIPANGSVFFFFFFSSRFPSRSPIATGLKNAPMIILQFYSLVFSYICTYYKMY